jgi:penicillin-binding protein 1C
MMAHVLKGSLVGIAALLLALAAWVTWPLPEEMASPAPVASLTLEDRGGLPLRTTRAADGSRGGWVPLGEMDPRLIQAFLAAEDHRFFRHPGVDGRAVLRAARDNLRQGRAAAGASTLTMQTVRLLRETPRTWRGKWSQALWALRLDAQLDKRAILEQYLNRVPLGQGAVGVSAASSLYFGASAGSLSPGQAALLAGIARAPSRDNPLVSAERARHRRDVVLGRMRALGTVTAAEAARATDEPVLAAERRARFLAPHFTTRVLQWAEQQGEPLDGTWRTSLDLELQTLLEAEVRHTVRVLADRGARHAAVVVLDNPTGEVLAWVGSPDFWAEQAGQVDMVVSPRQPGSALKPFLFGLAFDRGHTAATVIPDIPRSFATATGPYTPQNYDRRFRGPVRAREALASSYNVPAVELTERLGAEALLHTLHRAGFRSLTRGASHYGLGLALGNGDVPLLELANAYRALARGGAWSPHRWRSHAEQPTPAPAADPGPGAGSTPIPHSELRVPGSEGRVVSAQAAALVLDILADADARAPGFGAETPFDFGFPVAAKTGTSRHFTDNWAVGVTGGFTVAVWVGNFSGRPMDGVSGVSGAGPLLYRSILATAARRAPGVLPAPHEAGLTPLSVCRLSGLRAASGCASLVEWFAPGTEPTRHDDWERGSLVVLPPEYSEWAAAERGRRGMHTRFAAGSETGRFHILSPQDGDHYEVPPGVEARYATLSLQATEPGARWFVGGREIRGARWRLVPGEHVVRALSPTGAHDEVRIVVEE